MSAFLSTPSSQRATAESAGQSRAGREISIHALFAEGDGRAAAAALFLHISIHALFAEGDGRDGAFILGKGISIHALFAEGDQHDLLDRKSVV